VTSKTDNYGLTVNRLEREYINSLDILRFEGKIHIIDNDRKLKETIRKLIKFNKIGFDTETKPSFKKGIVNPLAIIQFATKEEAYILQLKFIKNLTPLVQIFESTNIKKIGVGLKDDLKKLKELLEFEPNSFIDLSKIAESKGIIQTGLRALSSRYLQKRISKTSQKSNWSADKLTEKQKIYAATDAWAALMIYDLLINDNIDYRQFNEEENPQQSQLQLPPE
jgi:ribonuclease D